MKKIISVLLAVIFAVSFCTVFNVSADAPTVYVDGTAEKDGSGTKASPYDNIISAFKALAETGGTVVIIGDVAGDKVQTDYKPQLDDEGKVVKDEDGNTVYTDEFESYNISLPRHKNTIVVTSDGGKLLLGQTVTHRFDNYDSTIYRNCIISFGSNRVMFDSFDGHLIVEDTCTLENATSNYIYCTGVMEIYAACSFAHVFANYGGKTTDDTVFIIGNGAMPGTLWNGAGAVTTNAAFIIKEGAGFTTFYGGGQASSVDASVYLINHGTLGTATANSNGGVAPAKSFALGSVEGVKDFKATAIDYTVAAASDNTAKFANVAKEYKVTGDVNSFVNITDDIDEANKLFAIVDGEATEIKYWKTLSDGIYFSTVEGATNYVFADAAKEAEKPVAPVAGDAGFAVFVILAAVACAGIAVAKKSR